MIGPGNGSFKISEARENDQRPQSFQATDAPNMRLTASSSWPAILS
jgi:hypothetical protein